MTASRDSFVQLFRCACVGVMLFGQATVALAQAPIVQPGAPGEAPRELTAEDAIKIAVTSYSPADVRFMQDMIPHHHQAIEMAALAPDRTNHPDLLEAARRIIEFMQLWRPQADSCWPGSCRIRWS